MSGLRVERNIIFYRDGLPDRLRAGRYWTDAGMPQVFSVSCREQDWADISFDRNLIRVPEGMEPVFRHQFYGGQARDLGWEEWRALGADAGSMLGDPMFVDAAAGDFRLREGSPAFDLGFEPIPVEEIGPYEDELRASWPIVEAFGAARLGELHTQRFFDVPGYEPVAAAPLAVRGGAPNAFAAFRAGGPVRVWPTSAAAFTRPVAGARRCWRRWPSAILVRRSVRSTPRSPTRCAASASASTASVTTCWRSSRTSCWWTSPPATTAAT